jgi:hypothetical protein
MAQRSGEDRDDALRGLDDLHEDVGGDEASTARNTTAREIASKVARLEEAPVLGMSLYRPGPN